MDTDPDSEQHLFRKIVWPFALAETLIWASSYYIFPAMLLEWERDLGWSKTALVSAFTTALIISAALAPVVGRLIDHGFARFVFAGSVLLAAAMLALLSQIEYFWQFFAIWIGLGIAMAGMLYEPTFVVLTRAMGERAKQSITLVTLVAGFAGTLSFPAAHYLANIMGWRNALLVFAATLAIVAVPLVWRACVAAELQFTSHSAINPRAFAVVKSILRKPAFWCLATAFTAIAINHGAIISHLLPILAERNISGNTAVLVASMLGPMQVTGRLLIMAIEKHVSMPAIANACFVAFIVASIAMLYSGNIAELLILFIILQGAGNGIITIVRPILTAEILGRTGFGTISGMLAVPFVFGLAVGPTLAALVWNIGGYDLVLMATSLIAFGGLLIMQLIRRYST